MMIAMLIALGSASSCTARSHAVALASGVGTSARARSAIRSPVAVLSRASSASTSTAPAAPCATSACSSRQRRSVSTTSPSSGAVPVHASRRSPPAPPACSTDPASAFTRASWWSEPGSARAGEVEQRRDERRPALLDGPRRLGVGGERRLGLQQQPLHDADLGLGGEPVQHQGRRSRGPCSSASRVISHAADQHSVRGSGSAMSPMRSISVVSERSSSRIVQ